jgi:hypothetical protein
MLGQHLSIAKNDSEQIVEVVRYTAGELAHRFHLLRLAELLGSASLIVDVGQSPDPLPN